MQCRRARVARRELGHELLENLSRPALRAGADVELGADEIAPPPILHLLVRRQSGRVLGQLRPGLGRSPTRRRQGGYLERCGNGGVRPLRRQRQMPRAFLRIGDDLSQPTVERPPLVRCYGAVCRGREQLVAEAHALAGELDHSRARRAFEIASRRRRVTARGLQERDGRL